MVDAEALFDWRNFLTICQNHKCFYNDISQRLIRLIVPKNIFLNTRVLVFEIFPVCQFGFGVIFTHSLPSSLQNVSIWSRLKFWLQINCFQNQTTRLKLSKLNCFSYLMTRVLKTICSSNNRQPVPNLST